MSQMGKTEGACVFCGRRAGRGAMSRHLQACAARKAAIHTADGTAGDVEPYIHLQVQDASAGNFWLHLEMHGGATLKKLDACLRAIWLECCGHRSRFTSGGWGSDEIGMGCKAQDALGEGVTLTHIYDFGSTSMTMVKVVGRRKGRPLRDRPILLMSRNEMPAWTCAECGEPGAVLCRECVFVRNAVLCEAHAATHPHEDYGEPLPLVNSPRVGTCGYEGPADPPY